MSGLPSCSGNLWWAVRICSSSWLSQSIHGCSPSLSFSCMLMVQNKGCFLVSVQCGLYLKFFWAALHRKLAWKCVLCETSSLCENSRLFQILTMETAWFSYNCKLKLYGCIRLDPHHTLWVLDQFSFIEWHSLLAHNGDRVIKLCKCEILPNGWLGNELLSSFDI